MPMSLRVPPLVLLLLALVAGAAAQPTLTPMIPDRQTGGLLPNWQAVAPFAPQAGLVHEGRLHVARLDGTKLRVASAPINQQGVGSPTSPEGTTAAVWTLAETPDNALPGASAVIGSDGRWIIAAEGTGRFYLLDAGREEEQGANPPVYEFPLETIEAAAIEQGVLRLLSRNKGNTWIAGKPLATLGQTPDWQSGPPLPDARTRAAFLSAPGFVLLAGGQLDVNGQTLPFNTVFRADVDAAGHPSTFGLVAHRLPEAMTAPKGVEVNGFYGVLPRMTAADATTSQTLTFATSRPFGAISSWRTIPIGMPAAADPVAIPYEQMHQLIVAGGAAEPARLHGFGLPPTADAAEAMRQDQLEQRVREHGLKLADFQAALVRAADQGRHHVVFVLDGSPESDAFRRSLNLNRSLRVMLEECVLSEPSAEDRPAVLQRIGAAKAPALGLLSPEGQTLNVFDGIPDNKGVYELLQPMWSPRM